MFVRQCEHYLIHKDEPTKPGRPFLYISEV